MSQEALATACAEVGAHGHTAYVIHALEAGKRHVKINDVITLAYVLGVSPLVLMMPASADATILLTATQEAPAAGVWEWMVGLRPAPTPGDVNDAARSAAALRLNQYVPYASRISGTLRVDINNTNINESGIAEIIRDNDNRKED